MRTEEQGIHANGLRTVRSHWKVINGNLVPKKTFPTEKEALAMARFLNTKDNVIHKMVAYKCIKCGQWHIGSNNTILTEEIREKYRKKSS